jgi:taurine dioxygenase
MSNEIRADVAPLAVIDNAETWHADGSHKPAPYRAVALHVVRNPARGGGETEFCDLRALYDALPESVKAGLCAKSGAHHWSKSRNPRFAAALTPEAFAEGERVAAMFPETLQPLVCRDETDGRPHLFLSPRFTLRVEGLPPPISTTLLENLFALMEEEAFLYRHQWLEGDLVLWDNRRTNHRVRSYAADDLRSRYRVTVSAAGPMRPFAEAA